MDELQPFGVALAGSQLIEASAGTGKTYTITTLVLRLLLETDREVEDILVVTFTRAATAELKERIRLRLHDAVLALRREDGRRDPVLQRVVEDAVRDECVQERIRRLESALALFDEAPVFTIHGFCQRVLQDNAFETGAPFEADLLAEEGPLLREIAQDYMVRQLHDAPPEVVAMFRKKVGLDGLLNLAYRAIGWEVELLPAVPELEPADLQGEWRRAYDRVVRLRPTTDLAGLPDVQGLNGNKYRRGSVPRWIESLDAALRTDRPLVSQRCDKLDKFSQSVLNESMNRGYEPPEDPFFMAVDELVAVESRITEHAKAAVLKIKLEFVDFANEELRNRKARLQLLSYDDLLIGLRDALRERPGLSALIRSTYPVALIDEFQDTDPIQYEIFARVFDHEDAALFLIGDPKQAIYAFRGADVFAYLKASAASGTRWTLPVNYRSDPSLVRAINGLFERVAQPFYVPEIAFRPVRPRPDAEDALEGSPERIAPVRIRLARRGGPDGPPEGAVLSAPFASGRYEEAVAADVARTLDGGLKITVAGKSREVVAGDLAILTRRNAQAHALQLRLRELGIPSVMQTDASVFETGEAVELERILRALSAPGDQGAVRAALATPWFGVSASSLAALRDDDRGWDDRLEDFRRWNELWRERGFVQAFQAMLEEADVMPRALAWLDGERRVTNLLHLAELLHRAAMEQHLGVHALVNWMTQVRVDADKRSGEVGEDAQVRLESDAHAVQLTSVHRSKGLEYPIVFLPYLWDGSLVFKQEYTNLRFHDPISRDLRLWAGLETEEESKAIASREAFAENLRLLYVALTRARHQVVIGWGAFHSIRNSALGYLLHGPTSVSPGADVLALLNDRLKPFLKEDGPMVEELRGLAAQVPGVEVADLPLGPGERVRSGAEGVTLAGARRLGRSLGGPWRAASFSRLILGSVGTGAEHEARDHDAGVQSDALAGEPPVDLEIPLATFPAGAAAGDFFHKVLETISFQAPEPEIELAVRAELGRHGFEREDPAVPTAAIASMLSTTLWEGGPALQSIPAPDRLVEMEFTLPVAHDAGGALTRGRLAAVLDAHGGDGPIGRYAAHAARLGFPPLRGYLRGFVDLIFRHDGRFYVADYKSNRLGTTFDAYQAPALARAMVEHHYVLQYLLYQVALHRHLRARLSGYDPSRHLGGVVYLFLRGMAHEHGYRRGVFVDHPPVALVHALDRLLAGEERS